jgi:ABC-type amino acid transport system permease subunit
MNRRLRLRFWIEFVLSLLGGALSVLSLFVPTWFERLSGSSPDNGSGALEWVITLAIVSATALLVFLARWEWRRSTALA